MSPKECLLTLFHFLKVVWGLPVPGGHAAGDLRQHRGRGLHLRRGVLHQHLRPRQGLHPPPLPQGTKVMKGTRTGYFRKVYRSLQVQVSVPLSNSNHVICNFLRDSENLG